MSAQGGAGEACACARGRGGAGGGGGAEALAGGRGRGGAGGGAGARRRWVGGGAEALGYRYALKCLHVSDEPRLRFRTCKPPGYMLLISLYHVSA